MNSALAVVARTRSARATETYACDEEWIAVCRLERILPETGACALVAGRQVAVFRLGDGSLHVLDNRDPCSGANVLSRGIVGDAEGVPVVFSPLFKDRFVLTTGECLEHPDIRVAVHPVRVVGGTVEVASGLAPALS